MRNAGSGRAAADEPAHLAQIDGGRIAERRGASSRSSELRETIVQRSRSIVSHTSAASKPRWEDDGPAEEEDRDEKDRDAAGVGRAGVKIGRDVVLAQSPVDGGG